MKKTLLAGVLSAAVFCMFCSGCATPSAHIGDIQLGMNPDQVRDIMGPPYTIRASKKYENGETSAVWEYIAPVFSAAAFSDKYDKTYWVIFENGKVVQWGEPGDFSGSEKSSEGDNVLIKDYFNKKIIK